MARKSSKTLRLSAIGAFVVTLIGLGFLLVLENDFLFRRTILLVASIVIVDRALAIISAFAEDNDRTELREFLEALPQYLTNASLLTHFDTTEDGLRYCCYLAERDELVKIRNTILRYGESSGYVRERRHWYGHKANSRFQRSYQSWMKAKHDALERGDVAIKEIISKSIDNKDTIILESNVLSKSYPGSYSFVRLDDVTNPMIQMSIFSFGVDDNNRSREVVLGWRFPNVDAGSAFSSQDQRLIDYLVAYFELVYAANHR